jgi:hypothetical protein
VPALGSCFGKSSRKLASCLHITAHEFLVHAERHGLSTQDSHAQRRTHRWHISASFCFCACTQTRQGPAAALIPMRLFQTSLLTAQDRTLASDSQDGTITATSRPDATHQRTARLRPRDIYTAPRWPDGHTAAPPTPPQPRTISTSDHWHRWNAPQLAIPAPPATNYAADRRRARRRRRHRGPRCVGFPRN